MALARFFERVYAAVGRHGMASRESLEQKLADVRVVVAVGACTPADELATELFVNMASRLYPRLEFVGHGAICDRLASLARAIQPAIEIGTDLPPASEVVSFGSSHLVSPQVIHCSASGWLARLAPHSSPSARWATPYAAAASAALAAAEVFRRVFLTPEERGPTEVELSLLDFAGGEGTPPDRQVQLGRLAVVGLGAVGNALIWTLARDPGVAGDAYLVDQEKVELSNLQRYVLTTDASIGASKTDLAAEALRGSDVRVTRVPSSFEDALERIPELREIPSIAISVDNVAGRRAAQASLPRLLVNGWTSDSGLGASWHRFNPDRACLACLYHPTGPAKNQTDLVAAALGLSLARVVRLWISDERVARDDLETIASSLGIDPKCLDGWDGRRIQDLYRDVVCGAVALDMRGTGRLETVPLAHQSVLAGILLAAELVKRSDPALDALAQPEALVAWHDVTRRPPSSWRIPTAAAAGCICSDPEYRAAFADKWSESTPPD